MAEYLKGKATVVKVKDAEGQYVPACAETSSTLSQELETTEVYSKLDDGKQVYGTFHNWSVSMEGLYQLTETGFELVEEAYANADPVEIQIAVGDAVYTGKMLITSMEFSFGQDDMTTVSLSGQGIGTLNKA